MAKKTSFGPDFDLFGPNLGCQVFFPKIWLSITRYHGQLSCTVSEKINDPILRKRSDGRMDGQKDGHTD